MHLGFTSIRYILFIIIFPLVLNYNSISIAQDNTKSLNTIDNINKNFYNKAYYESFNIINEEQSNTPSFFLEISNLYNFTGRHDLVLNLIKNKSIPEVSDCKQEVSSPLFSFYNLLKKSVNNKNIVIINETHHISRDRAIIIEYILPILYENGYRYLAAEDFKISGAGESIKGFYTNNDPIYNQLIRNAIQLGFTLVPYINWPSNNKNLKGVALQTYYEEIFARTLVDKIYSKDPDAKVFVLAGYQHIFENTFSSPTQVKPLGTWIKEKTKFDPLTIDQVYCSRMQDTDYENLLASNKPMGSAAGQVDIQILHEKEDKYNGRAPWLYDIMRVPFYFTESFKFNRRPILIEAKYADAPRKGTIADRLYLRDGETFPLMLEPGRYTLETVSGKGAGERKHHGHITVEASEQDSMNRR